VYFHHKFDHVFEGSPAPHVTFIVCATPRSGSSLLCELLASTELAGAPSEVFDRNQMHEFRRVWAVDTFDEYLDALMAKKTSPNGVFGIKTHYHQLIEAFGDVESLVVRPGDLDGRFPNLHLVYIKRLDHIRQAVSFARATQTEQWTSAHDSSPEPPSYDREQIGSLLDWIEREEVAWERFFAESTAPLFRIVYEELADAIEETIIQVMRFLDIDLPPSFEAPAPTIQRQADALNDEWAARYLAQAASR
jgi:LPS sulfotransferase NodH